MVTDRVNTRNNNATNANVDFHAKRIQAGLSTQIVIQVKADNGQNYTIGAVQSLSVNETRDITEVYEVGTDAIIQLVPRSATTYSLDIDRMIFDFQRLPDALQRDFRHIHAQRHPFDLVVTDYNPYLSAGGSAPEQPANTTNIASQTSPNNIATTFGNCWFTNLSFTYNANDYLITERCNLKCEYVRDNQTPGTTKGGILDNLEASSSAGANSQLASIMSVFDAEDQ